MSKEKTNIVQFNEYRRAKALEKYAYIRPKPIKRLTEEEMKSSNDKRRRED